MIEIKNLNKSYEQNGSVIKALDEVTLTLPDKGLILVVGKNGSGKTTLLNMLGLIDTPDSGSISVNGQDILGLNGKERDNFRSKRVSYIFQNINLLNSLTAKENILLVKNDEKVVAEALAEENIENCARKVPTQMSQGQTQKVAIIRAMLSDTDILLSDEPTASLDVKMKDSVVSQLNKASKNKLVIVVTHDIDLQWAADIIIRFEDGKASAEDMHNDRQTEEASCEQKIEKKEQSIDDKSKGRKINIKMTLLFGLRSIKRSFISSIVFVLFAITTFVSFALLLGCPQSSAVSYYFGGSQGDSKIIAKVYDQNDNDYVIVKSYDEIPEKGIAFSKFTNITFIKNYEVDDDTTIWHMVAKRNNLNFTSNVANQSLLKDKEMVAGRLANGSTEIVITDYLADCLVERGIKGKSFADYDDVISNGYLTLEYNALQVQVKIVGIVKTDASRYSNLKNYTADVLPMSMRHWENLAGFIVETDLEAEIATFIYNCDYSYCLCYNDCSIDDKIIELSQSMNIMSDFSAGDYYKLCQTVDKDTNLNPNDIYSVGDGEAIVSLSVFSNIFSMISDGISQGKTSSQVIREYVSTLPTATVEIYGEKYNVGAYYDDLDVENNDGKVYFQSDIAERIYQVRLSEDTSGTYAVYAEGKDLAKLSEKYDLIFFPEYYLAVQTSGNYGLTSVALTFLSMGLLVLTAIFIISDIMMYCKTYSKQLAIMRCIGMSNSAVAFTALIKYLILMLIAYALSFAVSLPVLSKLSDLVTAPYKLVGFITFSPWSILLSIAYVCVILAVAYVFGLDRMKKRSLISLLR